ncbi:MAG: diaminopimelate epimerase [Phycisphaerales bacterium]|nr:diaminopimelate epimerase [Phycisphaerales bacterium]
MPDRLPKLTWMQGTGNRFALVDECELLDWDPSELAKCLGTGSDGIDGLLVLMPATERADIRMGIFNADGSSAQMCGNGIRCVALHLIRNGNGSGRTVRIQVGAHVLAARVLSGKHQEPLVCTRMPVPEVQKGSDLLRVQLGNAHGILIEDELPGNDDWARQVGVHHEHGLHELNLHVVRIIDSSTIEMKSWERGVGPTVACASGATAAVAGLISMGLVQNRVLVKQPGGVLRVHWRGGSMQPTNTGAAGDLPGGVMSQDNIDMEHEARSQ